MILQLKIAFIGLFQFTFGILFSLYLFGFEASMESRQNKKTENTSEYNMKLVKRHNGAEAGGTGLLPEFESAGISILTPAMRNR